MTGWGWYPRSMRPITSHEELDKIDESLTWAVRLWQPRIALFKLPGWVAVPVISENFNTWTFKERLQQTLTSRGYNHLYAVQLHYRGFLAHEVPLTVEGLDDFRFQFMDFHDLAIFAGMPKPEVVILSLDKFNMDIVNCNAIAGQADLVLQVLGCEVSEAFSRFQSAIMEMDPLRYERKKLMQIYDCLKDRYEQADEGAEFLIT